MNTIPQHNGPYETETAARKSPAVRKVWGDFATGTGGLTPGNLAMLTAACWAARVELGAYDMVILKWLAGFEPQMCAVVAGLITRAAAGSAR